MKYDENIVWFLNELACSEVKQIDAGKLKIKYENKITLDGEIDLEIIDLAKAASQRILALEAKIAWMSAQIGFVDVVMSDTTNKRHLNS